MATTTTNYGLTKPAGTDKYDISVFNGNADKIDSQMKANENAAATAKAAADSAQSTADSAQSTANSAQSTANSAQSTANTAKNTADAALPKAGGTMTGKLVAQSNTDYTTKQVRNVVCSTVEPTSSDGANGDLWAVYE